MSEQPGVPRPAWHYLTWLSHLGIQVAIEVVLVLLGLPPQLGILALPVWVGREVGNLLEKRKEQGRLYWWDWLDSVGDLVGPCAVIYWVWSRA